MPVTKRCVLILAAEARLRSVRPTAVATLMQVVCAMHAATEEVECPSTRKGGNVHMAVQRLPAACRRVAVWCKAWRVVRCWATGLA